MERRKYSLRRHILRLISVPIILAGFIIGGFAFFSAYEEIYEVSDAQLVQSAKILLRLTEHELSENDMQKIELGIEHFNLSHSYEDKIAFRIWSNGILVAEADSSKSFDGLSLISQPGFSDQIINGEKWRFFIYKDIKTGITVETAELYSIRAELIWKILGSLLIPCLVFIPVILLLISYGTLRSLKPLRALSRMVDQRDANDLTPLEAKKIPEEIYPLLVAFNRLLKRVADSLRMEREFTDNAAHELRTPLAAMKTQTQVLIKNMKSCPEYKEGLIDLQRSIDRATHMVSQLLSFARVQSHQQDFKVLEFSSLVQEVLKDSAPHAVQKNIELEADIEGNINVHGNSSALAIMVRNILENAIKFTPQKGLILVSLKKENDRTVFAVRDSGSGIPEDNKAKVFERFYRKDNGKTEGSGLGLSMVKWICEAHDAKITLEDNQPHGLVVSVSFNTENV